MLEKILRFIITAFMATAGLMFTEWISRLLAFMVSEEFLRMGLFGSTVATILSFIGGAAIGGGIGFLIAPYCMRLLWRFSHWVEARLNKMPLNQVGAGAVGLIIGLILSNLLGTTFQHIPVVGSYIPGILSIVLGYLGMNIAVHKREEIFVALPWFAKDKAGKDVKAIETEEVAPLKILDTSVIIDGRIADICSSGFLEGALLVPVFVLAELQHIADSSDSLKRNRGRRGLDVLNRMQKEYGQLIRIENRDFDDVAEVDAKLVRLAQVIKAKIVTNDYNLNKVAELQGVAVLNINELSNAVKPVVLPGEEMVVHVVKDGKESGQGVAYLDDGTMIVVEAGRRHIGETIGVAVTSVLQTSAGRMIFAKPKVGF